jgi:DNA-binding NarL/FixJ family response regulator/tetratricopeptide (TPR) repeat protein
VGRRRELAALAAAVPGPGGRLTRFVALSGEPGIGKTRLLEELAGRAKDRNHLILAGRGAELEDDLPFGVWVDALDDHVAQLGPDRLRRLLGDRAGPLSAVLPAALDEGAPAAVSLPDERFRAHRAVGELLEALGSLRPALVVLDDLHWADDASLELLGHLLRRPPRAAIVVALAFRSGGLPAPLLAALATAERGGALVHLRLGPLSESDIEALVGAPGRDELYRVSGGNPFYALELAHARAAGHEVGAIGDVGWDVATPGLSATEVPPAVAAAIGYEIDALGAAARLLTQGAAVAGEAVELGLAAAVARLDEVAALAALDEAVAAGLLRSTGVARHYRFRHPIVRRAVYESAGEGWRLAAHARAAAALAASGGSPAAQAHHVERCAGPGDEAAIALLAQAGQAAAPHAPAAAARWYAAALRLVASTPAEGPRRFGLLVGLATAQAAVGRLEHALGSLRDALALLPAEAMEMRVPLVAACATCENLLGRHRAAHERLVREFEALPDPHGGAAASLQVELAADALFDTDFAAMAGWAEAARAIARSRGDEALIAVASALLCFARYAEGSMDAAEEARAEAAAALDGLPDDRLAARLDAPYYLGFAEFFCERYDEAIRHLERGIAVSRAVGSGQFLVPMMVGLAHAREMRGQLREALDTAQAAVEAARLAGNRQIASWALVAEGWTAAMTGDLERARSAAEEAVELLAGLDESVLTLASHAHAAVIFLEAGQTSRCLEEARVAGAPELARIEPGRRAWLAAALARAELARGHPAGAREWLARAENALGDLELPLARASVLDARATLALAEGDAEAAAQLAERAAGDADAVGATVQAARSRALAGRAHAQAGDGDAAVALLARAEAELTACGAHRLRDEAARELRRLGRRVSARQRRASERDDPVGSLSGRQREIAELVALGRTNREIAAELFLSEKTVEGHLTTVFAKLGVSSRAAVAAAVGRAHAGTP